MKSYIFNSLRKTWKHVSKLQKNARGASGNQQSIGNEVELATKFIEKIKDFSYEKYEGSDWVGIYEAAKDNFAG